MATPADNNFAPPKSHVADVKDQNGQVLATRGQRFLGALVDLVLALIPASPVYWILVSAAVKNPGIAQNPSAIVDAFAGRAALMSLCSLLFLVLLVVDIVFIFKYSATIGKRVVGTKIVRLDGSHASFSRIFWLRSFVNGLISFALARFLPIVGRLYGLIDVCFIFGKSKRCVHDYLAGTIVVKA